MRYASLLFVSFLDNHSKISFPYGNLLKKNSINETRSHTFIFFFNENHFHNFNTHGPNYESTFPRVNCSWKTVTSTAMC